MKPDKQYIQPDGRSLVYIECDIVDEDGVMLPSADNLVKFDITGNARIVGVDNGRQESREAYKWGGTDKNTHSEREAYNGKVLVIVQSENGEGGFTLVATSDYLVPVTLNMAAVPGVAPSVTRPALGTVTGVENRDIHTIAGSPTVLPRDVVVIYSSGVALIKQVTWDAVDPAKFDQFGGFAVSGTFDDTSISVKASINVIVNIPASRVNVGLNTALGNNSQQYVLTNGPLATASFTSGTNYPNNMLNGNTTNFWDNYAQANTTIVYAAVAASRPYEFVETYWPREVTVDQISLYFTTSANHSLPAALNVQYWDGFNWVNAANQTVTFATASNGETRIVFDTVTTSRVRVGMQNATPFNATTGRMRIVRFETWGYTYMSVDKEALLAAIAGAPTVQGEYTDASWQALQAALAAAVRVTEDGSAAHTNMVNALGTLRNAINNLELKVYAVSIVAGAGGKIVTGESGDYIAGAVINLAAETDYGYQFVNWTCSAGEIAVAANAVTTFTVPSGDATVTANFLKIPITSLAINAPTATTVARGGTYSFTVTANPGALTDDVVWTISNTAYATVTTDGKVTVRNLTGSVMLTATAPSGVSHSILLRIM